MVDDWWQSAMVAAIAAPSLHSEMGICGQKWGYLSSEYGICYLCFFMNFYVPHLNSSKANYDVHSGGTIISLSLATFFCHLNALKFHI